MNREYEEILAQVLLGGLITNDTAPDADMRVLLAYTKDWAMTCRVLKTLLPYYQGTDLNEYGWKAVWEGLQRSDVQ
jgi:hypothetical protein